VARRIALRCCVRSRSSSGAHLLFVPHLRAQKNNTKFEISTCALILSHDALVLRFCAGANGIKQGANGGLFVQHGGGERAKIRQAFAFVPPVPVRMHTTRKGLFDSYYCFSFVFARHARPAS
jgi:hypothetical protein